MKRAHVTGCQCGIGASYPAIKAPWRRKLLWCVGRKEWRPWCEGGAPDVRCDSCVVGDKEAS